jgi:parallel beta-helix repeat protein
MRAFLPVTAVMALLLAACSSNGKGAAATGGGAGTAGNGAGGGSWDGGVVEPPAATCNAPVLVPVTAANADHVVGDGTAASCTADALQAAATAGGIIGFDCGADPITITVSAQITFTNESVLDGGGLVTLSGGGNSRILYLDSGYDQTTPRLTVQRLTFRQGQSPAIGEDTAQGGGAIYRDGGSLTVMDSTFEDNHGPATGQDVAGGAIYAFGGGETVISGSTFAGNSASDGGAVGSLNGDLTVINSTFVGNAATGTDGNPGNGGCGGGIYMDGADEATSLCGVTIRDNTAGAIAGGFFRVSNYDNGTFTMDRCTVGNNRVTPTGDGNAGGLYLQGLAITITNSSITTNQAFYNGGIWINERTADLTNVTIAENTAFGSNGGGVWLGNNPTGTLLNCTIANNHSTATDQVAGAIFGSGLALKNTVVSGNTAMWVPGCDQTHTSSGGNLQWPDGALCTDSPLVADPELGALGDNGGVTETMLPSSTSPARSLGTGCPAADQRGEARTEPCTAGAVEVQ